MTVITRFVTAVFFALLIAFAVSAEIIYFQDCWGDAGHNLISQSPSGVEIIHSVPAFDLSQVIINGELMHTVTIPGDFLPNDAGAPDLPRTGRFVAIPKGAWAEVELVSYRIELFHNINLAPAFVLPWENDDSPLVYKKDAQIYSINADYPAEPVQLSEPVKMRGVDAVVAGITPFQYNPATRDLTVYKDIRIRVNFYGGSGRFGEDRLRSRWWEPVLRQNLVNYASLPQVDFNCIGPSDQNEGEYLIIVPDDPFFIAWADTIKQWRTEQGITTVVTTISEIGGNDAVLIENYIDNAYATWEPALVAVLLLSDYENSGDSYGITSPVWDDYCVSDNIYADVNGDDLPELIIGRITAQTPEDLDNMISKMMEYERSPATDPGFYQHPCIAGGWQDDRWFILCCEIIWGYFHYIEGKDPTRQYAGAATPPTFWSTNVNTQMIVDYFGPSGLGYIPADPSYLLDWGGNAERINADLNSGAFIAQHRDHGEEVGWSSPSYTISDLAGLSNDMYPYVFSINCLTGKFNNPTECFAEAFHRMEHGALGVMAASEVSYSFVNDVFTWGVYDVMWPDFMPDVGADPIGEANLRPAVANQTSKWFLEASTWPSNPQSKDVTYHLFHHHGDAFMTLYSEVPQNLTVVHDDSILGGSSEFTVAADDASVIALSIAGELVGSASGTGGPVTIPITQPVPGQLLKVTVTKANYYRYMVDVPVYSPEAPYVAFNSCQINDAVTGNNNGQWDFGEIVDLAIEVKNVGVQNATGVDVTITSSDQYVTVIDDNEYYGDIAAGDSLSVTDGFRVEASGTIPDQHEVDFVLTTTSGSYIWESYFSLTANSPVIVFQELDIQDPLGNNNGFLDPGETADFDVTIHNNGNTTAEELTVTLVPNDPLLTVAGNPVSYGDLNPATSASGTFTITCDPAYTPGTMAVFTLDMTASGGYAVTDTFQTYVGDERNQPCGPDAYGYYAWDDMDGGQGHQYDWVEIAPSAGGSGTVLALTNNNQTTQVTLPFDFAYYRDTYSQVSICTNGWLVIGYSTSTSAYNSGIPGLAGPSAMVAAFWNNLDPSLGSCEICTYDDAANNRFIVEWYNIPHYNQPEQRETFQVILYDPAHYPTTSGDGIILVQYNTVIYPNTATFGIENQSENIGLQYGYYNNYDPYAWPVENGRTITYTTEGAPSPPPVSITLTPYGTPITIPSTGGSFDYNISATNNDNTSHLVEIWCDVTLPNSSIYGPTLGPVSITMTAGITIDRDRAQAVPAGAPAGNYSYNAYAVADGDTATDSFPFEKLADGDGGYVITAWENDGESFDPWIVNSDEETIPEAFGLSQAFPNPFNPTTTISFQLPFASWVKLDVFDINGCRVGVASPFGDLALTRQYSPGSHQITFDGSGLSSGLYFYRIQAGDFTAVKKMVLLK
ncbi:hypothetical protein CEE37_12200 [candidate division LCP-89 bacterium B3_LCP]|uniref:Gingipain R n=1 Tax=candidate division LCP-89 bacterium B3_LCP TaxID=2012998 RepID=A0A532UUI0_UNCL8|nr:MAG: hypothetical protein CEE37_12200 [candidate division LCP-89 bacterium B3_LCP]